MNQKTTVDKPVRVRSRTMIHLNPTGNIRQPEIPKQFTTFHGLSDDKEHLAIVFGELQPSEPVLVRLHSECLTGDTFGSFLCDCRAQLYEAIDTLDATSGVLLYMRQEGRGIGLYNKLDAYRLQQTEGVDTFVANKRVGFPEDARSYSVAAAMLLALGIKKIVLLSNNPDKARQLSEHGIDVVQQVPTRTYLTKFNRKYLSAKRASGHRLGELANE